jgi:hypothetical protein
MFLRKMGFWRVTSVLILLLMVPLMVRMALDSGISWDECKQLEYGERLLAWYRSGFTDRSSFTYVDLYLYGGLFDLPAKLVLASRILPWGPYETRHVLTALLALLGIVATWLTANKIAGPRAGMLAGVMLTLTPAWVGHGLFNCKDIPFGAAAAFVAYSTTRIAMRSSPLTWGDALLAGLSAGCALGFRPGGMFLLGYPVLAASTRLFTDFVARRRNGEPQHIARDGGVTLGRLLCVLPEAWAVMLIAWPWAQVSPFLRPLSAAAIARHFSWGGTMRFNGRVISTDNMPASYLPIWFKVTLPDTYLLAIICAVLFFVTIRARNLCVSRTLAVVLLVVFVVVPFVGVVVTRPIIYDAHRHFLFLMPALAALAGLAIDGFIGIPRIPRAIRLAMVASLIGIGSVTVYDMWSLHPYQYVYFNRLSGGLRYQADRFETDYWGLTYREGFDWVVHNVAIGPSRKKIRVAACNANGQLRYYRTRWGALRFVVEEKSERAEINLGMLRGECRDIPGTIIHTVVRQGVPLSYVRRRESGLPGGSYANSCRDCAWTSQSLECQCRSESGNWVPTSMQLPCHDIANHDGRLQCD